MKPLEQLPTEFKRDDKTQAAGRYLITHPLIHRYYFEVLVDVQEAVETVKVKLVCLVSANKGQFRNVTRYCTWDDAQMIREAFFNEDEYVIQEQRINHVEVAEGNYFSTLILLK